MVVIGVVAGAGVVAGGMPGGVGTVRIGVTVMLTAGVDP